MPKTTKKAKTRAKAVTAARKTRKASAKPAAAKVKAKPGKVGKVLKAIAAKMGKKEQKAPKAATDKSRKSSVSVEINEVRTASVSVSEESTTRSAKGETRMVSSAQEASLSEGAAASASAGAASSTFKNFRHHTDMENFYRFINDNDLRFEALEIIDNIIIEKRAQKQLKTKKARAH